MKPSTVIALTQMWESFSFFGMRSLLVLYLISGREFDSASAIVLYTLYVALTKVMAGVGGVVVDRFLKYKQAVIIGGLFILSGHLFLTFSNFFIGLSFIIVGSALFRVSLQTLLGLVNDPKGFTMFYTGMNLGGLSAAILCGFVAQVYGWHLGFGLAAFGMAIGLIFFTANRKQFNQFEVMHSTSHLIPFQGGLIAVLIIGFLLFNYSSVNLFALPFGLGALIFLLKRKEKNILFSILLLTGFAAVEELWGSMLMLFSETHVNRVIFGTTLPSSIIAATNPLVIIIAGPFLAKLLLQYRSKLILGFISIISAFLILSISAIMIQPSVLILIGGLSLIAIGEVLIIPSIFDYVAKKVPGSSTMTGATILALAVGALLSGNIAKIPLSPAIVFLGISIVACFVTFGIQMTTLNYRFGIKK